MYSTWAPLQAAFNSGPVIKLDNQEIWLAPINEFAIPCRISKPLQAELSLLSEEDGVLIQGIMTGQIIVPCNLCTEDTVYDLNQRFATFEAYPDEDSQNPDSDLELAVDEYVMRVSPQGLGLEINLGALLWEEFAQALPLHPLCKPDCAGLCSKCGHNKNQGDCSCTHEEYDPRMEKLRGLKINR